MVLSTPWSAELFAQLDNSPRDGDEIDARLDYREGRIRGNSNKNNTYGTLQVSVSKVLKTKARLPQPTTAMRDAETLAARSTAPFAPSSEDGR